MRGLVIVVALVLGCCTNDASAEVRNVLVDGSCFSLEVVRSIELMEKGLSGKDQLCGDCGMLFVFEVPGQYAFWMKDTALPLSVAFLGEGGRVLNIAGMTPFSRDLHFSKGVALYALEVGQGWFSNHGIEAGDVLHWVVDAEAGEGCLIP